MDVLFCMKGMEKHEFMMLPGVEQLLRGFRADNVWWVFKKIERNDQRGRAKRVVYADNLLAVTDCPETVNRLSSKGICCIGYQKIGNADYFDGVELVLNSFEGLDTAFFLGIHHRFRGLAVVIRETERLIIRESLKGDFEQLYQISRETDSDTYTETMTEDYNEAKEGFFAYIACQYRYYGFGLWSVVKKETGEIIGRCGLSPVVDDISPQGRVEIGYLISTNHRHSGYGYEACRSILNYAFEVLGCPEVMAVIHQDNYPSQKLAEKLGFVRIRKEIASIPNELWRVFKISAE